MQIKVGFGYDMHQLIKGRDLIVGGVTIDHIKGLQGHSDADVLIHAICDAYLVLQIFAISVIIFPIH